MRQAEVPHPRAFVGARSSPSSVGLVARNRSLIIIEERTHRVDECDLWAPLKAVQQSSRALSVDHPSSNLIRSRESNGSDDYAIQPQSRTLLHAHNTIRYPDPASTISM
ncbi:hypothetical protein CABS01_11640 [Colletotrichum abscissum]|uniref:Uncharacterized protein n=2 Tax=Colletotrichum acutatum species complex TaxID=2707335 RepID=A0A9P9XJI8_9PEZI|nr:uncharacterized protein CTAM01_16105 [Colletotrichum tamarilloi]XP_060397410.1 uncharacterized protein CABS01_11640 [Colletotrichum abscissum]KAI3528065.1 hypothetical protein CSPX01_16513 [Colletotrichum filicis]KAI3554954.1 hypothetical protein CABS02_04793 [Colletotrichum abscissum]KAK1473324.1 hypothetical protein CTAM01_16105 [Colletotrichum tamarilloi]KAK1493471.1 hypothetical protein CABS01_11640 [Colletotrichum abscissum]